MTIETARAMIPNPAKHPEMEKLLELDLDRNSLVVMIGSYKGFTTQLLSEAYGSRIMCYDPQKFACEQLRERRLDNVEVFQFGLGKEEGTFPMWEVGNDACSFHPGNSTRDPGEGKMKDVVVVLKALQIDLMFINCEGSEFDILDRLDETGLMKNVRMLMVQFHKAATKGNGQNYERQMIRLKKDYTVMWTIGSPWTLLQRHTIDDSAERPTPSPGMNPQAEDDLEDNVDERPACPKCSFVPPKDKNYALSMAGHKRSHEGDAD